MWKALATLAMTLVLGACASMNQLNNDVSTYSLWPAERKPTTYAFERLPSQQANPQQQQMLEDAAARALEQAGFKPAADLQSADVTVTLGARVTATQMSPYDDPFWWHGGLWAHRFHGRPYWRAGFHHGYGYPFGYPFYSPVYTVRTPVYGWNRGYVGGRPAAGAVVGARSFVNRPAPIARPGFGGGFRGGMGMRMGRMR